MWRLVEIGEDFGVFLVRFLRILNLGDFWFGWMKVVFD